ncbi:nitroreductase family protein [Bosea sp. NPDC055332]
MTIAAAQFRSPAIAPALPIASNGRVADHPIDPVFLERWSPRSFAPDDISEAELMRCFEAARWAPSSYNSQPWRFVYARRGSADWANFLAPLSEFNQSWAGEAAALITVLSKTKMLRPGSTEETPAYNHSFDAGAAWASFALQAAMRGWNTHCMAITDRDLCIQRLAVPEGYRVEATIAIGRIGDKASLPPALRERETPSSRDPVSRFVSAGRFGG